MSQFQPAGAAARLSAGATRELSVPVGSVRTQLLQAIRRLGFTIATEQYSVIEGERGSRLRGLSLTPLRIPLALRVNLVPAGAGCTVTIRVEDRWGVPVGRNWGAVSVYANVFTDVLVEVDAALKRADPKAAEMFAPWWRDIPEQDLASRRNAGEAAVRAEQAVQRRTSRLLDGPRSSPRSAVADAGLTTVTFVAPDSVAHIAGETVDAMLTAGQLIAASPGEMPAALVTDVQTMVVTLERQLDQLGSNRSQGAMTMYVTAPQVPVITFLYQQAMLRDTLPVRLLMSCTTCRLEKVINPDLVRMRERSRRVKVLSTSVGAVFGAHNISPFILVGRLAQLKNSEPDFVCLRCQGTDADQMPITFCPRCGERRAESVLRRCRKCDLDLRTRLDSASVWRAVDATPATSPAPIAASDPSPAPDMAPPPHVVPATPQPSVSPVAAAWSAPAPAGQAPAPPPGQWAAPAASPYPATSRKRRQVTPTVSPSGWHPDPFGRFEIRFWDGRTWTAQVSSAGVVASDPPN